MSQLSAHGKEAHPSRKKILTICEITIATLQSKLIGHNCSFCNTMPMANMRTNY